MDLESAAKRLEALGAPTRLEVFRLLVRAGPEGLPVGAIQQRLGVPGSTLSHHLQRLIAVDLLTQERQGATLICQARYDAMDALIDYLSAECCSEAGERNQGTAA